VRGEGTRHRYHDDEFVVDAAEYLVDGDDDGGAVFAGFAGTGGAERDASGWMLECK
jgi:hypothetical protein